MTVAIALAWTTTGWAQDDGPIGNGGQALVTNNPSTTVSLADQQELGLVTVGGCSGTLINRYWVLTAHHCVAVGGVLGNPLLSASTIRVSAAWTTATATVTRIETFAFDDLAPEDVALLFLGAGDLGPANTQPFYVPDVDTSTAVQKYGRGISVLAKDTMPPTPAFNDGLYRTASFTPDLVGWDFYRLPAKNGQVADGGDSGGPDFALANGVLVGIAGVQSTCHANKYVTGYVLTGTGADWTWATEVDYCGSASTGPIREQILAIASEVPEENVLDLDPISLPGAPLPSGTPPIWLYAVTPYGDLRETQLDPSGGVGPEQVGNGWDEYVQVLPAGGNSLFAIDGAGDLWWYRHDGFSTLTFDWEGRVQVGNGWTFQSVFSGGNGVLYAVRTDGTLLWYRFDDFGDASSPTSWSGPTVIGSGWDQFTTVVSTGHGTIYGVLPGGDLWRYHHDGFDTGAYAWSGIRKVGTGWDTFEHLVPADDNVLLAVATDGRLLFYKDLGLSGGTSTSWQSEVWIGPVEVGSGWAGLPQVFALLPSDPSLLH